MTPNTSISDDTYQLVKSLLGDHDPVAAELLREASDARVYVLSALTFCAFRSSNLKARRASLESLRHLHPELCATVCLGLALGKQFPLAREMGLSLLLELRPELCENGKLCALEKHPQAAPIERVMERPFEGKYEARFLQLKSGEYIPDTLEDASRTASYALGEAGDDSLEVRAALLSAAVNGSDSKVSYAAVGYGLRYIAPDLGAIAACALTFLDDARSQVGYEFLPVLAPEVGKEVYYTHLRNSSPPGQAYGLLVLSNVEKDMAIDVAHRLFNSLNAAERDAFLAAIRAQYPGFGRALKLES